ncbi:MAG: sigma-70 family RNA polymerase sigma factor [Acidobacteria bacterium]|nr:sigma-70 family RNA polymerase sigma factor [Acidobacteriota bacterium]
MLSHPLMTERASRMSPADHRPADPLLSDEPTIELVIRARGGDRLAVEALLQRCLPALKRWAHGKLPPAARGALDTGDLVQEAVLHALQRLDAFEPRHVGAMQAYLRRSVINRIRDEVRRVTRQPAPAPLADEVAGDLTSPLEFAIQAESYERYRRALQELKARDRKIVLARVEVQWSVKEIAQHFGMRSLDAARMAVGRALQRLSVHMRPEVPKA